MCEKYNDNQVKVNFGKIIQTTKIVPGFKYIKPSKIVGEVNGKNIEWESIKQKDSVHIIINDKVREEIILVLQVRLPVYVNDRNHNGFVFEACAGLVDKEFSGTKIENLKKIAQEELAEEIGLIASTNSLKYIRTIKTNVGISGSNAYLFYLDFQNCMMAKPKEEDLPISLAKLSYNDVNEFIMDDEINTDAVTLFLISYVMNREFEK
jgi:hypothetical protein